MLYDYQALRHIIHMNNIFRKIFLTFAFLSLFVAAKAQSQLEDIVNGIRSDRVSDIAKYFDNIVPITINNVQNTYSRTQAEMVLKDFFNKNTPKDLIIMNSGSPNNTSKFAIGDLTTSNGKYSIYFLLKQKDNSEYLLQEIRINKE